MGPRVGAGAYDSTHVEPCQLMVPLLPKTGAALILLLVVLFLCMNWFVTQETVGMDVCVMQSSLM